MCAVPQVACICTPAAPKWAFRLNLCAVWEGGGVPEEEMAEEIGRGQKSIRICFSPSRRPFQTAEHPFKHPSS